MEELFLYIVYLTPGVIGSLAVGYVIHCVISLVGVLRKKGLKSRLFGAVRTFLLAATLQIALAYGGEKALGYFPTDNVIATMIYLFVLFLLVAVVARHKDMKKGVEREEQTRRSS